MQNHAEQILARLHEVDPGAVLEDHAVPVDAVLAIAPKWELAPDNKSDPHCGCVDSPEWDAVLDRFHTKNGPGVIEHLGSLYVVAGDWKYPIYFRFDCATTPKLSEIERAGVRWLAQEFDWFSGTAVTRRSDREFDLEVNHRWFVEACLTMWRASYAELEYLDKLDRQNTTVAWREFECVLATARQRPMFTRTLLSAVHGTWNAIAPDAGVEDNDEALELVLDADRIAMYGSKVAHEELKWLDEFYGYEKVQRTLSKKVQLV